jgi:predicted RNase H-like nuclease (RuvC/YqgF family)
LPSAALLGRQDVAVGEEWSQKGATLSAKTARNEFRLTQDEILAAIDAGQLPYRVGVIHGNSWSRVLRREVDEPMTNTHDERDHRQRRERAEVARVNSDLKTVRSEVKALKEQRHKLLADLEA